MKIMKNFFKITKMKPQTLKRSGVITTVSVLKENVLALPENYVWYDSIIINSKAIRLLFQKELDSTVSSSIKNFLVNAITKNNLTSIEELCQYICYIYGVTIYIKKFFFWKKIFIVIS